MNKTQNITPIPIMRLYPECNAKTLTHASNILVVLSENFEEVPIQ